jgi:hypothetical protein
MLRILLSILVLFLCKFAFFKADYPDALIILVLSSLFTVYKFLEDKKVNSTELDFQKDMKKELDDLKGSVSVLKMGRSMNGR